LKIGNQEEIGQERMCFEKVESVLGNSAPRITDFIDYKKGDIVEIFQTVTVERV